MTKFLISAFFFGLIASLGWLEISQLLMRGWSHFIIGMGLSVLLSLVLGLYRKVDLD